MFCFSKNANKKVREKAKAEMWYHVSILYIIVASSNSYCSWKIANFSLFSCFLLHPAKRKHDMTKISHHKHVGCLKLRRTLEYLFARNMSIYNFQLLATAHQNTDTYLVLHWHETSPWHFLHKSHIFILNKLKEKEIHIYTSDCCCISERGID